MWNTIRYVVEFYDDEIRSLQIADAVIVPVHLYVLNK